MVYPAERQANPAPAASFMSEPEQIAALSVRGLRKSFDKPAVDGLDLRIKAGEFYTLLVRTGRARRRRCGWSPAC
jgi:hypothetical protein